MNPETYGASQYMRRLETAIRKQKDVVQAARITGDGVLKRDAQSKITDLTARYKQVAEASGLKTRMEKTQVGTKTKTHQNILTSATGNDTLQSSGEVGPVDQNFYIGRSPEL